MKKYRRVMSHDTEEWCKVWKKLTFGSKNWMQYLVNFNASSSKSRNLLYDMVWLSQKSTEEFCVLKLKNDANFEVELTYVLKNDMRNLRKFDVTLKICTLMGFFLPKYIMFEPRKYRGVMHYYTEDRCKLWRKNDL